MSIRLEASERGGDRVLQTKALTISAGKRILLQNISLTAEREDIIALVGPNGAGKTTFISTVLGEREPESGEAKIGASVAPAWYRQDLTGVPMGKSIYDVIHDLRPGWNRGNVQNHLGAFGFSGDQVKKKTDVLSGGERARVALAMITLVRANLLVLDEPTNHLDVESIEVLEDALQEYEGTIILVSHDRQFLRELATRVWYIDGMALRDFQGTFTEWEATREEQVRARRNEPQELEPESTRETHDARRAEKSELRRLQREVEAREERIVELESEIASLETELARDDLYDGSDASIEQAAELTKRLQDRRSALEAVMAEWATASERLERSANS